MATTSVANIKTSGRVIQFDTTVNVGAWSGVNKNIVIDESLLSSIVVTVDGVVFPNYKLYSPQYLPIRNTVTSECTWALILDKRIEITASTITIDLPAALITDGVITSTAETIANINITNDSVIRELATNTKFIDTDASIGSACVIAYVDYVSGNDGTGATYLRSSTEINNTPMDPSGTGSVLPYKTVNAAQLAAIGASGTHKHAAILFKRGVTNLEAGQASSMYINLSGYGGVDTNNMLIFGAYGPTHLDMPTFEQGDVVKYGVQLSNNHARYILFQSLRLTTKATATVSGFGLRFLLSSATPSAPTPGIIFDGMDIRTTKGAQILLTGTRSIGYDGTTFTNCAIHESPADAGIFGDSGTLAENRFVWFHFEHCLFKNNGLSSLDHGMYLKGLKYLTNYKNAYFEPIIASSRGAGIKADHVQIGSTTKCIFHSASGHTIQSNGTGGGMGYALDRSDTQGQGAECLGVHVADCVMTNIDDWAISENSAVDCLVENTFIHTKNGYSFGFRLSKDLGGGTDPSTVRDSYRFSQKNVTIVNASGTGFDLALPDNDVVGTAGYLGHHDGVYEQSFIYTLTSTAKPAIKIESSILQNYNAAKAGGRVSQTITNIGLYNPIEAVKFEDGDGVQVGLSAFVAAVSDVSALREEDPGFSSAGSTISDYIASLGYGTDLAYWDDYALDLLDSTKERGANFTVESIADYVLSRHQSSNLSAANYGGALPTAMNWAASVTVITTVTTRSRDRSRER